MASLSCFGQARGEYSNSYTNQFHLLWECQDSSSTCILPPTHALCVRTLRKLHPHATIKLWSSTLDEPSLSQLLQDLNIQLTRYDMSFFDDLPQAAKIAAVDMQERMHSTTADHARENSYSHWSDLFRAAVLYKEGGVYTDLDSIWLRPITAASEDLEWIPKTPALTEVEHENDAVTIEDKRYFLEGGIMRFDRPNSPFLKAVLETFPEYDQEMAECWACVGPRQLTRTYNAMDESNPSLIDSASVFGVKDYRNYFANMFREFDPVIWSEILNSNEVAAHLFTASPQTGISKDSTIYHLLRVGGVTSASTDSSASWRHAKKERRNLLSSLYYLEYGSAITATTDYVVFDLEISGIESEAEFQSKESEIAAAIAQVLEVSVGDVQLNYVNSRRQLQEYTNGGSYTNGETSGAVVQATVYTSEPMDISESLAEENFVPNVNELLEDDSVQIVTASVLETGSHDAIIGDGSVIYWYGNGETVTASVTVTDNVDMPAYESEIRSIFMGAFEVPLSAVSASGVSEYSFSVTVNDVISAYAQANLAEVSDAITDSTVLPNGSSLGDADIPATGYTQATIVVSKSTNTNSDNVDALLQHYLITVQAYELEEGVTTETDVSYTVTGSISCAVRASWTADEIATAYARTIGEMLEGEVSVDAEDDNGEALFEITCDNYLDASNNVTRIEFEPQPFRIPGVSEECYWEQKGIVMTLTSYVQKTGVTHTQMSALTDTAQEEYEQGGFTFLSSEISSYGQQEVGACEMLAECRADYEELYEMLAGANVDKVSRDEVSDLSWWWDFQIGRYVSMRGWVIDMENVKFKDGFFYYAYGDDWLVNTCVQHSESWADPCDNSAGYCAGGGNYGFSSQQATALTEALEQPSFIHPKCPSGCQALDDDWLAEIAQAAPSLPDASLSALCILDSKYFFWVDPLTIVETCVGYNDQSTALCPLSDYIFCSDIDYDTGSVVYGNSTYQGYSLEYALSSDNYRHPQCL